jgi:hypothetical protein
MRTCKHRIERDGTPTRWRRRPGQKVPARANRSATAAVAAIAAFTMSAAPASAGVDRKAPSKPTNLRLTAKTTTTISIAWDAATDNSGKLSYEMRLWQDPRVPVLPQTQTSFTWTGLQPSKQYYLSVWRSTRPGTSRSATN